MNSEQKAALGPVTSRAFSPFYLLPCDHRDILRGLWAQRRGPDGTDCGAWITGMKAVVLDGLLRAVSQGVELSSAAILVDDEYGAPVIERARATGVTVCVPVDQGELGAFRLAHGERFAEAIETVEPDVVTALVEYDPSDPGATEVQRARLEPLLSYLAKVDRDFLLEVQITCPARLSGETRAAWVREARPALICTAIRELRAAGARPKIWKLEACVTEADSRAVAQAAHAAQGEAGIVVLGAGAPIAEVESWLALAAGVEGYLGFAVGRSVWAAAIKGLADGSVTREQAVADVARRYARFVAVFEDAPRSAGLDQPNLEVRS